MEINTRDFGTIQVEDDAVYNFPDGVYGFEEDTQFAVFQQTFDEVSFLYLQSTKNLVPCFLIFEPWELVPHYEPSISSEDLAALKVSDPKELIMLVIAKVPSSIEELSLNIKSPIALNAKTMVGRQTVLQNPDYPVRFMPFVKTERSATHVNDR